MLNGYSALAFLSCGRRENFLFGKQPNTVQRLCGLPRIFGQRSTAGVVQSCLGQGVTLKNKSEMLAMTKQAVRTGKGKARLRQDWLSSKEGPTASCFCTVRLPVASCLGRRMESVGTLSGGQNSRNQCQCCCLHRGYSPGLVSVFPWWGRL